MAGGAGVDGIAGVRIARRQHGDVGGDQESEKHHGRNFQDDRQRRCETSPQHLAEFETKTGVNVLNDIAAPLGGEVTMAFDGPMIPTPRWKLIFEVYDPTTLQATIAKLVDSFNREATNKRHSLQLTQRQVGSRTYFVISSPNTPNSEVDYTFVDNYLIAAPDMGTISRAIQSREAGYTLDTFDRPFKRCCRPMDTRIFRRSSITTSARSWVRSPHN